ncbi:putative leader peptide [Streptomyces sp. NPDC087440]|uniref:putative leader peptide n=1 Tax=Streptomyces sp. NPDC087440 TaxID=3365790 RepID=UPI00381827C0
MWVSGGGGSPPVRGLCWSCGSAAGGCAACAAPPRWAPRQGRGAVLHVRFRRAGAPFRGAGNCATSHPLTRTEPCNGPAGLGEGAGLGTPLPRWGGVAHARHREATRGLGGDVHPVSGLGQGRHPGGPGAGGAAPLPARPAPGGRPRRPRGLEGSGGGRSPRGLGGRVGKGGAKGAGWKRRSGPGPGSAPSVGGRGRSGPGREASPVPRWAGPERAGAGRGVPEGGRDGRACPAACPRNGTIIDSRRREPTESRPMQPSGDPSVPLVARRHVDLVRVASAICRCA